MEDLERGRKEAEEYYKEAQADHVTEIVIEERKRRSWRILPWYLQVDGNEYRTIA